MKKLFGVVAALAVVMAFSVKVGAYELCFRDCNPKPTPTPISEISINNEHTDVVTVAKADVDTGSVTQFGGTFSVVKTGSVYQVGAVANSNVNMAYLPGCACSKPMNVSIDNEHTDVMTVAKADVETGKVSQWGKFGFQTVKTGRVSTVGTNASSVVNYVDFSVDGT